MYGKDEKAFIALSEKFRSELEDLERQIGGLERRRRELIDLFDGSYEQVDYEAVEETLENYPLHSLVLYIKEYPGLKKQEILEAWGEHHQVDSKQLSRLLEKAKRRRLIISEGKGRASVWHPTTEA